MSENEKRRGASKVPLWLIVAVVLIFMLILGIASAIKEVHTNSQNYNEAIELIEQGKYGKAETLLNGLKDYKDGKYLYSYAFYLEYKNSDLYKAHKYLNEIPENYSGKFSEEIAKERPLCESAYEAYEKERKAENDRKAQEYKNNLPAVTTTPVVTTKPYVATTKKKEEKKYPYDEYDVYDYYDEEDFYYDHEDDFWDFEDAEDYFNEAWDNVD